MVYREGAAFQAIVFSKVNLTEGCLQKSVRENILLENLFWALCLLTNYD